MRFKQALATGVLLMLPALIAGRLGANDGILRRIHRHGDCPANQSVVRLPAQEIRIETTRPRVIVNEGVPGRTRGNFGGGHGFAPFAQGPVFATFLPVTPQLTGGGGFGFSGSGAPSSAHNAIRAMHELELQAGEVNRMRAAHKADMDHLDRIQQRVQAGLAATFPTPNGNGATSGSDVAQIKASIDALTKRVSDIEKLLIIHDNILQANNPPKK